MESQLFGRGSDSLPDRQVGQFDAGKVREPEPVMVRSQIELGRGLQVSGGSLLELYGGHILGTETGVVWLQRREREKERVNKG